VTGDREEFIGRNGSLRNPQAVAREELSGRVGAGLDPCAAIQTSLTLAPGEAREVIFVLGQAGNATRAGQRATRYRSADVVRQAFDDVRGYWDRVLGAIQVETPDPAMDLLVNRWLLYQVLSCRFWGRTAFYQSGGAYGFRDQLQDAMALAYGAPGEARAHLLRSAARQFVEGDVQHWWHPPRRQPVRTPCSDAYLGLPFVVHPHVTVTGDAGVLDEAVPFLSAPLLRPDQEDDYSTPATSGETASLYEHCARALKHSLRFGPHGLPLMGHGDWN